MNVQALVQRLREVQGTDEEDEAARLLFNAVALEKYGEWSGTYESARHDVVRQLLIDGEPETAVRYARLLKETFDAFLDGLASAEVLRLLAEAEL